VQKLYSEIFFNFKKGYIMKSGVLIRKGVCCGISERFPLWNCRDF